jgi:hypothetical protein
MDKRIFTYEEALELLPEVQRITANAASQVDGLNEQAVAEAQEIIAGWADELLNLGLEVKGLWLVDFDSGSGYYCWQHPETSLQFFHDYDDGFRGRVKLN